MLALGSSDASAQDVSPLNVAAAVKALDTDTGATPLGSLHSTPIAGSSHRMPPSQSGA